MANKIIGLKDDFDLLGELRDAASVTLVMAFAKMSGWNAIRESLLGGKAQVNIIVGLNFAITDPEVLSEWLHLKTRDPYRLSIEVAPTDPVFHPKVILVERRDGSSFAIVGSGNLTGGGLSTNVECGVLIDDQARLDELATWSVQLARETLSAEIIKEYKMIHAAAARAAWQSRKTNEKLKQLLSHSRKENHARPLPAWNIAALLREMDEYLSTAEGAESLKNRINGAREIRTDLDMPNFKFDKAGWGSFYGIVEFGRIRQSYKAMSSETPRLRKALRLLTADPLDEETLEQILAVDGEYHVRGLGTNLVSKILTVYDRHRWPVFNDRVKKTFEHYGLKVEWGATHYLAFSAMIRQVLSRRGKPDFWELDAFCEWLSRDM